METEDPITRLNQLLLSIDNYYYRLGALSKFLDNYFIRSDEKCEHQYLLLQYHQLKPKPVILFYLCTKESTQDTDITNLVNFLNETDIFEGTVVLMKNSPNNIRRHKPVIKNINKGVSITNSIIGNNNNSNVGIINNTTNITNITYKIEMTPELIKTLFIESNRHLLNNEFDKNTNYDHLKFHKFMSEITYHKDSMETVFYIIKHLQKTLRHNPDVNNYDVKMLDCIKSVNAEDLDYSFFTIDEKQNVKKCEIKDMIPYYKYSFITPNNVKKIQNIEDYKDCVKNSQSLYNLVNGKIYTFESLMDSCKNICVCNDNSNKYNLDALYSYLISPEAVGYKEKFHQLIGFFSTPNKFTINIRNFISINNTKYETRYENNKPKRGTNGVSVIFLKQTEPIV